MRTAALLLFVSFAHPATGQPQKKGAAPKLVEEGGKKALVFIMGETKAEVVAGDKTFKLLPLRSTGTKTFNVVVTTTNSGKKALPSSEGIIDHQNMIATDDTGREFRTNSVSLPPGNDIDPGGTFNYTITLRPHPDPKAREITVTIPARGGEADLWRIVYPKKAWPKGIPSP
jgi:hypothetical protein